MVIYQNVNKKLNQMKETELVGLSNFLEPDRSKLGDLLADIYDSCANFSRDPEVESAMSDEKELKDYAHILLSKLQ